MAALQQNIDYKHRYFLWVLSALKAKPITSTLLNGFERSSISFRLLCPHRLSSSCIGWVLGTMQSVTATVLRLVIAFTDSLFVFVSLSHFFLISPKLLLRSSHRHFFADLYYTEAVSCRSTFNFLSLNRFSVSLPYLSCLIGFSLFLQVMSCLSNAHLGCPMRPYVSVNHLSARFPFYTPKDFITAISALCTQNLGNLCGCKRLTGTPPRWYTVCLPVLTS